MSILQPLKEFFRSIQDSTLLLVDEAVIPIFEGLWVLEENSKIQNIIVLNNNNTLSLTENDILCRDSSPIENLLILISSIKSENLLKTLQFPPTLKVQILYSFEDSSSKLQSNNKIIPFGMFKKKDEFILTADSCFPPSPFILHIKNKINAFDLDIDVDLSTEYKSQLKRISLVLGTSIYRQLNFDISDSIYSIGFGSQLIANTISSYFNNISSSKSQKASLIIIDRTVDLWSPLHQEDDDEVMEKLHDLLIEANQGNEILPQLIAAIQNKTISIKQAFLLAIRSCSKSGCQFENNTSEIQLFAKLLNISYQRLNQLFKEVSQARFVHDEDDDDGKKQIKKNDGGPFKGSLISNILSKTLLESFPLPSFVIQAKKFDVANAALNLFGNVFGGGDHLHPEQKLKSNSNMIIFFLGGYSDLDVEYVKELKFSLNKNIIIGGTCKFDKELFFNEWFNNCVESTEGNPLLKTNVKPKDISKLFT